MSDETGTRARLLEAAGEVFAERGFQAATVKEICQRAQANIAAVNYHFRDKNSLYLEVLRYTSQRAREKYAPPSADPSKSAEERLREYVLKFVLRILDTGRPAWHGKLMAREMVEPTAALDELVKESVVPNIRMLESIIRELLGPKVDADTIRMMANSIIGQCLYYSHARPVIERLNPSFDYSEKGIHKIAVHVANFSLSALRNPGVPPGK
jgi:AcrR family transcriptional regulator